MENIFRKASPNERMYIEAQKNFSPLNIQILFEGEGDIDKSILINAVNKASDACTNSRLIYSKGKWIDSSKYPEVHVVHNKNFDGFNFEVLELDKRVLDITDKPAIEVIIIKGKINGILFRIFHGLMDGKGALLFIENVFNVLNNKEVEVIDSSYSDLTFLKTLDYKKFKSLGFPKLKILGNELKHLNYRKVNTKRIRIEGNYSSLVSKIIKVFTDSFTDKNSLFMIPVDLRKKDKTLLNASNLVLPIFLETKKGESYKTINERFIKKIINDDYLNINNADLGLINYMPASILNLTLKLYNALCKKLNVHSTSGTISYVGNYDLNDYSYESFKCTSFYSIPLCTPFSPVALVSYSNNHATEISISYYDGVISESKMIEISENIIDEVKEIRGYKEINNTYKDYGDISLLQLLSSTVKKFGEKTAVKEKEREVSYLDIDKKSDVFSQILLKKCSTEKSVVIFLGRSVEFIISVMACIKAGITFIPIDINDFDLHTASIIKQSKAKVIVTNSSLEILDEKHDCINIDEVDFSYNISKKKKAFKNNEIYRIYTSGSTGKAKCVSISHDNILNYLLFSKDEYAINESNGFAFFTSTSYDLSITSYLLPLICGSCIHIFKESFNALMIKEMLLNDEIDTFKMTPTHLSVINKSLIETKKKLLILGGEILRYSTLNKSRKVFSKDCLFVNEYGPTEATVGCTSYKVDEIHEGIVAIGKPISNTSILLLNENIKEVRQGEIGELYIEGRGLSSGYLDDQKRNDEVFIYINNKRYYKSGDLAYLSVKNVLVYCSRADKEVKINGRRVELHEIEKAILELSDFSDVVVRYDVNKKELIAFYTSSSIIDVKKIKSDLVSVLPPYLRVMQFIKVTDIPLLKSGKANDNELFKLVKSKTKKLVNETSLSKLEKEVKNIFKEVLNKEIAEIHNTLFELGGDSLDYINLTSEIIKSYVESEKQSDFLKECNELYSNITVSILSKILSKYI